MTGIVYVIGPTFGPYKIGRSQGMDVRLRPYRTHSPVKLNVWFTTKPLPLYVEVEKFARQKLRDYDLDYDWFDAPLKLICMTIHEAVAAVDRGERALPNGINGRGRLKPVRLPLNSPITQPVADFADTIKPLLHAGEEMADFVRSALEGAIAQRRAKGEPA